jgi:hypothetical protein
VAIHLHRSHSTLLGMRFQSLLLPSLSKDTKCYQNQANESENTVNEESIERDMERRKEEEEEEHVLVNVNLANVSIQSDSLRLFWN